MLKSSSTNEKLKKKIRSFWEKQPEQVRKLNLRHVFLAGLIVGSAYYFTRHILLAIMGATTVLLSHYSTKFRLNNFGLEAASLFTIASGYALGPVNGFYLGLTFIMLQAFTGGPPGFYVLWVIPSYGLAGYLAGSYNHIPIESLGPMLVAGFQTFFFTMTLIFSREYTAKYFHYAVFNFAFNTVMFTAVAPTIIQLLS